MAAVAGGVNAMLLPITTTSISALSALSPSARCKTFDASADGYGRGEGFAALILARAPTTKGSKPSGGVYALVRGTGVNQDGRSSSLTAPNGPSQTALVRDVLTAGGLVAAELAYMATHGTGAVSFMLCTLCCLQACHHHLVPDPAAGTPLGDPIEVNALGQALRPAKKGAGSTAPAAPPLAMGSVKSCYGHTEGAAGLTGTLLAAEALRQRCHPAVLSLRSVNPYVSAALDDWRRLGLRPAVSRQAASAASWRPSAAAGTSSFGMGGTNAHLVVAAPEARTLPAPAADSPWQRTRRVWGRCGQLGAW